MSNVAPAWSLADTFTAYRHARAQIPRDVERAVTEFGYRSQDVADAGGNTQHIETARRLELRIDAQEARLVGGNPDGELSEDSVVALVASNQKVAQPLWTDHRVYLRDRRLAKPVRRIAAALGTDAGHRIESVSPILAWYLLGSSAAQPAHPSSAEINRRLAAAARILAEPEWADTWPGPCELFVLGDPVPVGLPLGYARPTGLPGTQHHRLANLYAADVLKGTPTV